MVCETTSSLLANPSARKPNWARANCSDWIGTTVTECSVCLDRIAQRLERPADLRQPGFPRLGLRSQGAALPRRPSDRFPPAGDSRRSLRSARKSPLPPAACPRRARLSGQRLRRSDCRRRARLFRAAPDSSRGLLPVPGRAAQPRLARRANVSIMPAASCNICAFLPPAIMLASRRGKSMISAILSGGNEATVADIDIV